MLSFESCGPGANAWIAAHFRDCIYNTRDAISFGLGLASILAWLVAQVPQFVDNIRVRLRSKGGKPRMHGPLPLLGPASCSSKATAMAIQAHGSCAAM